jgi:catechol 2,3-dioxygenase-like lactoylglutathione lyase family enzyme
MFEPKDAFSGFSVDDIDAARGFYSETLGLEVRENSMGTLTLMLPSGQGVFVYAKDNHEPATYTMLNLVVDDVEAAVDELNERGVVTKIYGDESGTDEKGIARGFGPTIAWFLDPARNVVSVIESSDA